MSAPLYLRANVVMEPLVDSWYAWLHLISPATAARNVVRRHLPIMRSYVQAQAVHVAASRNPHMRGGPFIDYPQNRTREIRELIATTEARKEAIALSEAIDELNAQVERHPFGGPTEALYARVPEPLKGYILQQPFEPDLYQCTKRHAHGRRGTPGECGAGVHRRRCADDQASASSGPERPRRQIACCIGQHGRFASTQLVDSPGEQRG